jgi:hypothetical protein
LRTSIFACEFHWNRTRVNEQARKDGLDGIRDAYEGARCAICGRQAAVEYYQIPEQEKERTPLETEERKNPTGVYHRGSRARKWTERGEIIE